MAVVRRAGSAIGALGNPIVGGTALTYTWTMSFITPTSASTSSNRYSIYIGAGSNASGGASRAAYDGFFLQYCDNVNSGNWQLIEVSRNSVVKTTTSSVAPTFGAWNTLVITYTGPTNTVTATLSTSGGAPAVIASTTSSQLASAGNYLFANAFTMAMNWLGTVTQGMAIDYASLVISGISRT